MYGSLLMLALSAQADPCRFAQLVHREYSKTEQEAARKNQYLVQQFRNNSRVCRFMTAKDRVDQIAKRLEYVPHPAETPEYHYDPLNIRTLSPRQLVRVFLIIEALKDAQFRNGLGRMIESDYRDKLAEHGGIVIADGGRLVFRAISSGEERTEENNTSYRLTEESKILPAIFWFHIHAAHEDNSGYDSPSDGVMEIFHGLLQGIPYGDIPVAQARLEKYGECHHLLLTLLPDGKFNVDYFGGDRIDGQDHRIDVVDLGVYSYKTVRKEATR